jgi:hypothetical protein
MEKELLKKIKEVNILNVDENSVVVIHVDVTALSSHDIDLYATKIMKQINPVFKKRGADIIVVPFRGEPKSKFEIIKKKDLKVEKHLLEGNMKSNVKKQTTSNRPIQPPKPKGQGNTKWSPSEEKMLKKIGSKK